MKGGGYKDRQPGEVPWDLARVAQERRVRYSWYCSAYQENVLFVKVYVVGSWAREPRKTGVLLFFQPYLGRIWRKQDNAN